MAVCRERTIGQNAADAALDGLAHEGMAVGMLAGNGHEQIAGPACSRIRAAACDVQVCGADEFGFRQNLT
jgi:hypothetical protein